MIDENRVRVHEPMPSNMAGGTSKLPWVVMALVILMVVIGAVLFRDKLFSGGTSKTPAVAEQKSSGYQAVFLTNGQVYFGKLSDTAASYATLEDIYYLQVTQPPIQGEGAAQQQQQQQSLQLIKLGEELHGPVDKMKINRDQILFYEDLKEDGKVMQAIRENQNTPKTTPTPATQTQGTPPQQQQAPVATPATR